jgi:hypothetical protein
MHTHTHTHTYTHTHTHTHTCPFAACIRSLMRDKNSIGVFAALGVITSVHSLLNCFHC